MIPRPRPVGGVRAALLALATVTAISACRSDAIDESAPSRAAASAPAAPTTVQAVTTQGPILIRDGDTVDVAQLSREMAASATGDPEWIAVMADLRSRSWLAARYPGRFDLADIYSAEWAVDNATPLEQESLELGVYVDEPPPILESVVLTRQLGRNVELEVVIRSQKAVVRRAEDDAVMTTLPGGRRRGLFSLGPAASTDTDRPWRIHSIAELAPPADPASPTTEADE